MFCWGCLVGSFETCLQPGCGCLFKRLRYIQGYSTRALLWGSGKDDDRALIEAALYVHAVDPVHAMCGTTCPDMKLYRRVLCCLVLRLWSVRFSESETSGDRLALAWIERLSDLDQVDLDPEDKMIVRIKKLFSRLHVHSFVIYPQEVSKKHLRHF